MTHPALIERITRSLAYMLRHQPERFDLELDPQGWGEIEDVVRALNEKLGEPIEESDLRNAISSGDRPRYELDGARVRALYGHSIPVEPGEPSKPPEFLYVGVAGRDVERAQKYGLRGGRRRFLHLARSAEEAREAGRRVGREYAVLTVFALDAWEEGINFYDRQALFLAEEVPTQFIELQGDYDDGYDAPPRPEHGGRSGGGRGPRGEGRRDERGRDGRRGDRPDRGERSDRSDRGDRGDRPRRDERPRRDDRPPRDERPRREERPQREERAPVHETRPEPARAVRETAPTAREEASSSFGLGVFEAEQAAARAPRKEPAPQTPPPAPAPREVARKEPEPSDDGSSFGAGL